MTECPGERPAQARLRELADRQRVFLGRVDNRHATDSHDTRPIAPSPAVQAELARLRHRATTLDERAVAAERDLRAAQDARDAAQCELATVQAQCTALQRELAEVRDRQPGTAPDHQQPDGELARMHHQLAERDEQLARLTGERDREREESLRRAATMAAHEERQRTLALAEEQQRSHIRALEAELAAAREEIAAMHDQTGDVEALQAQLANVRGDLSSAEEVIDSVVAERDTLRAERDARKAGA